MNKIAKGLFIGAFIFNQQNIYAQSFQHQAAWTRIGLAENIAPKWAIELEYQHRRQNGIFEDNANNPAQYNQLNSGRAWVFYRLGKYQLQISPASYWGSYSLWRSEKDFIKSQPNYEYRASVRLEIKEAIKKLTFKHRYGVESRWQSAYSDLKNPAYSWRLRYQVSLSGPVKLLNINGLQWKCFDEIFYSLPQPNQYKPVFDQNRLFIGLEDQLNSNIRLEVGYQHTYILKASTDDYDLANVWRVYVYLENIISKK